MSRRAVVQSIGYAVPDRVITNQDLEKLVDTSDEWIFQRTGIRERRICGDGDSASSLSVTACQQALDRAGVPASEVQMIVCGTVTGDMIFPSTACLIQDRLGAVNAGAFDVGAACAGFIYAMSVAASMIESGQMDNALVIGVDVLSRFVDWTDRSTCVLFGDGAGAVLLRAEDNSERGVLKTVLLANGGGWEHIKMETGGSLHPMCDPNSKDYQSTIFMAGAEVYRFAVHAMGDACLRVLEKAGMDPSEVDLFVPHQANRRIIDSAAGRLGLSDDRVFINVNKYGNTSGGSIPIALYEAEAEGRLKRGDLVLTVGFGAGLVWGANLIRW
jgi:3-oxoacyl-[acyl-carrier-protein] synthase III